MVEGKKHEQKAYEWESKIAITRVWEGKQEKGWKDRQDRKTGGNSKINSTIGWLQFTTTYYLFYEELEKSSKLPTKKK